jgi:aspartyl aminopeptidase
MNLRALAFLLLLIACGWGCLAAQTRPAAAWDSLDIKTKDKISHLSEDYKKFISRNKIGREVIDYLQHQVKAKKCRDLRDLAARKATVKPGDRLYFIYDEKNIALLTVGRQPLSAGARILVAHHATPCLMVSPNPLDNDRDLAVLSLTQFQGVKTYQWLSRPLAIHGEIHTKAGLQTVVMGENDGYVFIIPDLAKAAYTVYTENEGRAIADKEKLKLVVGSVPIEDKHLSFSTTMQVLKYLNDRYDATETDFIAADLKVVPAGEARDVGLHGNLIGGFGHDGKAGCFALLHAFLAAPPADHWSLCLVIDQNTIMEEDANNRLQAMLADLIGQALALNKQEQSPDQAVRNVLKNSDALVAEVTNGVNPLFEGVDELHNAAYMGNGIVVMKYLGIGGKYYTNDASAEYMANLRKVLDDNGIYWQSAEFGKVDEGGGSSMSKYVGDLGIDVADVALPVLSMHAPFDICSKFDLYQEYLFFKAFLTN